MPPSRSASPARTGRPYLVESLPADLDLALPDGVRHTGPTLTRLVNASQESIDLTAVYWTLRPNPARQDESGFSADALRKRFGAAEGQALYDALRAAVRRGVRLRILNSPGFDPTDDEAAELKKAAPQRVAIRQVDMAAWYSSGIMHLKLWIIDRRHIYLGSANMDWRSFTQVKEMGVLVEDDPAVAAELGQYFATWWAFGALEPEVRSDIVDPATAVRRTVPSWSALVPAAERRPNPLDRSDLESRYSWSEPLAWTAGADAGDFFISGSPDAVCIGRRTSDEEALVRTILDAEESVSLSVMDFAPLSLYRGIYDAQRGVYMDGEEVATPVWWPALIDALLHVATTKALSVRLLVSEWAHTSPYIAPYLKAVERMAAAGRAGSAFRTGRLEVRRFRLPGWQETEPVLSGADGRPARSFPGHTRVNHAKYIVTDRRVNIGTSNMTWDYFNGSAGASFNTNLRSLVAAAQAIFDRDWGSPYAAA